MSGHISESFLPLGLVLLMVFIRYLDVGKRSRRYSQPYGSRSASAFRFLDLPPELREEILELAVTDTGNVLIIEKDGSHKSESPDLWRPCRWHARPLLAYWRSIRRERCLCGTYVSLLMTNRQVHEEVDGLLFKRNQLSFNTRASIAGSTVGQVLTARHTVWLLAASDTPSNINPSLFVCGEHHSLLLRRRPRSNVCEVAMRYEVACSCLHNCDDRCDGCNSRFEQFRVKAVRILQERLSRRPDGGNKRMRLEALAAALSEAAGMSIGYVAMDANRPEFDECWEEPVRKHGMVTIDT